MTNYLDELSSKKKRWWGFWVLVPLSILACVTMTLAAYDRDGQTTLGRTIIVLIDVGVLLLVLGLWDARRFYWCFRVLGLLVFVAYAWYLCDEFLLSDKPLVGTTGKRSEQSPLNSLLGFALIGIPALIFALKPVRKTIEPTEPPPETIINPPVNP